MEEEIEIAIVGGGICGLATALALHRKGIASVVLERSESLRDAGAAIGIRNNGWLALHQLGVAPHLRQTALPLQELRETWLHNGKQQVSIVKGEARCLKRSDLINSLADSLPQGTIRLGYQVVSVKTDPLTSYPVLHLHDGSVINTKVVIGCDGANSIVGDFLGLKPPQLFRLWTVRGFTRYPNGQPFANEFARINGDGVLMGRIPINNHLVYWFIGHQSSPKDAILSKDPELIRQLSLESIKKLPTEMIELVENSDPQSLNLTHLRYRAPWDILLRSFSKGTVAVAGDAMHVMGPFLGQGGAAGLEDAVVIAQCLARKLRPELARNEISTGLQKRDVEEALDEFVKKRRMRVARLSAQSYLIGLLAQSSSPLIKLLCIAAMKLLFWNANAHTQYDCGLL